MIEFRGEGGVWNGMARFIYASVALFILFLGTACTRVIVFVAVNETSHKVQLAVEGGRMDIPPHSSISFGERGRDQYKYVIHVDKNKFIGTIKEDGTYDYNGTIYFRITDKGISPIPFVKQDFSRFLGNP